jgi:hypothetical protein
MDNIEKIEKKIRTALKTKGNYSKDMDMAISLAAGAYLAYWIAAKEVEGLDKTCVEEISRERNIRFVPHPAFQVLHTTSETARRAFRELKLTLATVERTGEKDEMETIIFNVESVGNNGEKRVNKPKKTNV